MSSSSYSESSSSSDDGAEIFLQTIAAVVKAIVEDEDDEEETQQPKWRRRYIARERHTANDLLKMPPRRNTKTNPLPRTEAELNECISLAIAQHEALRSEQSGDTSGNNPPTGCTYKQFLDCKPLNFDGTGGVVAFVRRVEKTDSVLRLSKCLPEQRVTYISGLFMDGALSWWNLQVQTKGETTAYTMSWDELKELMRKKYCSRAEIQKLETEFWNLKMDGPKIAEYIQRFHDLSRVVPYLVEPEFKRIERFIWGLAPQILNMVTASKPPTISEAIDLSVALTEEALCLGKFSKSETNKKETHVESSGDNKTKFSKLKKGTKASHDNSPANKRRDANPSRGTKAYGATNEASGKGYLGTKPRCDRCKFHHDGRCPRPKCDKCGKEGHNKETCWARYANRGRNGNYHQGGKNNQGGNHNNNQEGNNNNNNNHNNQGGNGNGRGQGCFNCGDMGHFRKDCPEENQA